MAVPKRKTSKARRDKRRSPNMKMKAPGLSICPQCHEPKLPHRVCPNCNYYDGKDVMESIGSCRNAESEFQMNEKRHPMDAVFAVVWKEYLKKWLTFLAEKDNIIPTMKGSNQTRIAFTISSARWGTIRYVMKL